MLYARIILLTNHYFMKSSIKRFLTLTLCIALVFASVSRAFAEEMASDPTTTPAIELTTPPDTTPAQTPVGSTTTATMPSSGEEGLQLASSTPLILAGTSTDALASTTPGSGTTTIASTNAGTATTTAAASASTGDNIASSTSGATIVTGNALANTNVTNVVNVNVFNADALIAFLNRLASGDEHVDLRSLLTDDGGMTTCMGCVMSTSSLAMNASSTNDASITNNVSVSASTGNNTASSSDGSSIATGNAYANANVVNVANTNIIDSHYVMLVLNSFGSLGGDIVLPNASFFDTLLSPSTANSNSTPVLSTDTTNTANVSNNAATDATTGNNAASSTDSSTIQTGDSHAGTNVINTLNQNIVGGTRVVIVFRVYGNWSGTIYNMPTSFTWHGTSVGLEFLSTSNTGTAQGGGNLAVSATNGASITNNVAVSAGTGNNNVSGSHSYIGSGNAYANANIINMANTNIVGANWIQAIINIFGDWSGNISFGQPNLWIGTRVTFPDGFHGPSTHMIYQYTIKNMGDAPAHNVVLSHSTNYPNLITGDLSDISLGTLMPGQVKEVQRSAGAAMRIPYGDWKIDNKVHVQSTESDGNQRDNTDVVSYVLSYMTGLTNVNFEPVTHGVPAAFSVTKTNNAYGLLYASSTVDYTIVVKNNGGIADHALIVDNITSPTGEVIHHEEWDLGKVNSNEEITVTYTALFNASTTPGLYTNTAQVVSLTKNDFADSPVATSTVRIGTSTAHVSDLHNFLPALATHSTTTAHAKLKHVQGEVAGTSTATSAPVLASLGSDDQPQVHHRSNFAGALNTLAMLPWYWYVLLVSGAGIYSLQRRQWFGYFG
jgi:hypothetical protein